MPGSLTSSTRFDPSASSSSPSRSIPPVLNTTRTSEPGTCWGWNPLGEIMVAPAELYAHADRVGPGVLRLERALAEQEVDDAPLVRLEPVQLDRRDRPDVQPVDVHRVDQRPLELRVAGHGAGDQRRADLFQHLFLRAFHDGREGEHVFL